MVKNHTSKAMVEKEDEELIEKRVVKLESRKKEVQKKLVRKDETNNKISNVGSHQNVEFRYYDSLS